MSTDYSKMSDFEINSAVHNALMQEPYKIEFLGNDKIRWVRGSTDVTTGKVAYSNNSLKDYCNNPADAWPIIVANLIEVSPDYDFTDESEQELHATGLWTAKHVEVDGKSYYQSHQNPLRAAMIAFLMMQESKNAS